MPPIRFENSDLENSSYLPLKKGDFGLKISENRLEKLCVTDLIRWLRSSAEDCVSDSSRRCQRDPLQVIGLGDEPDEKRISNCCRLAL